MEENNKAEISAVLEDGTLVETIYKPEENRTDYVLSREGITQIYEGRDFRPLSADNSLIKTRFIKLPSGFSTENIEVAELFKEVRQFIEKYVQIPDDFLDVCTTYVMLTWTYDKFQTIPYLRVIGDFGTGKTTLLRVVGEMCYKAMIASGSVSTASVFRLIDQFKGTFVFDEADFRNSEMWSDVVKILNAGYSANMPVTRMHVKKNGEMEVQSFNVYGPKILGSREKFSDGALESRSITQRLMPMAEVNKPVHLDEVFFNNAGVLRNKLLSFRFGSYHKILVDESTLEGIHFPRLKQSALALTSMAKYIGEDVYKSIIGFLTKYEQELMNNQSDNIESEIMIAVIDLIAESKAWNKRKIYILEISKYLTENKLAEYSDKAETSYHDREGGLVRSSNYVISAKRVGGIINKMGIQKIRDGEGFYIDVISEEKRIHSLIERYGLTKYHDEKENPVKDIENEVEVDNVLDTLF